jgi:hypothetical protein
MEVGSGNLLIRRGHQTAAGGQQGPSAVPGMALKPTNGELRDSCARASLRAVASGCCSSRSHVGSAAPHDWLCFPAAPEVCTYLYICTYIHTDRL